MSSPVNIPPREPRDPITVAFLVCIALVGAAVLWAWHKVPAEVEGPAAARDIPPYHIITSDDLTTTRFRLDAAARSTLTDPQKILNHYTRVPIPEGSAFRADQFAPIADTQSLSGTIAVAITATGTTILLEQFRAGDQVDVSTMPVSGTNASAAVPLLSSVWVVDAPTNGPNPTVVLAIPAERLSDYVAKTRNASIVLSRAMGIPPGK